MSCQSRSAFSRTGLLHFFIFFREFGMRVENIELRNAEGRVLYCSIFRPGGKKLLGKGRLLTAEDVRRLENEGLDQVWVVQLEPGEIGEEDAIARIGTAAGCGSLEVHNLSGGRANLMTTAECCVLVDEEVLRQVNCTSSIVAATAANFSYAAAGTRVATLKTAPFAVLERDLNTILRLLEERGPILQARPIRNPSVSVLYCDPWHGERGRQLQEVFVRQKLQRFGLTPRLSMAVVEDAEAVTEAIQQMLKTAPALVVVASTTAPAGPQDVVGQAMVAAGCQLERFLAPVEPGNLLLLGYRNGTAVFSAPGCFRSQKETILDLLLPPMLAKYRLSGWDIACLGNGGLLE